MLFCFGGFLVSEGMVYRRIIALGDLPNSVKVTAVKNQQDFSLVADTCLISAEVVKPYVLLDQKPWIV